MAIEPTDVLLRLNHVDLLSFQSLRDDLRHSVAGVVRITKVVLLCRFPTFLTCLWIFFIPLSGEDLFTPNNLNSQLSFKHCRNARFCIVAQVVLRRSALPKLPDFHFRTHYDERR